jgi:hypothetical protein
MANPTVRLVTVARKKEVHRSIAAFQDELFNSLEWSGNSIDYFVDGANNDTTKLTNAVTNAANDARAAVTAGQRAVIVAGGLQATTLLQNSAVVSAAPAIPIVQAVGGDVPPSLQNYVTGFKINALDIAKHHLGNVNSHAVTVLYDDTAGTPSLKNFNDLVTYNGGLTGIKAITPLPASTVQMLRNLDPTKLTNGFMLIPNAMYYNHCDDIANYVDGKTVNGNPVWVYYPEREYKKAHTDKTHVKVYGYNIPLTYRWAAQYVDQILDGTMVPPLPAFLDAVADQDPGA